MKKTFKTIAVLLLCAAFASSVMCGCSKRADSTGSGLAEISSGSGDGSVQVGAAKPGDEPDQEPDGGEPVTLPESTEPDDGEPVTLPENTAPDGGDPEPEDTPKETEYGSGSWLITSQGGPEDRYDDILFVDGVLYYHYIESYDGKGGFGGDSVMPAEKSPFYGMTVEEIVTKLESEDCVVKVQKG